MQTSITFGAIETAVTAKGKNAGSEYSKCKAVAHFKNGDKEVTVMAFGEQRAKVLDLMVEGETATLTTVWDGKNVLKALDRERVAEPAAEEATDMAEAA